MATLYDKLVEEEGIKVLRRMLKGNIEQIGQTEGAQSVAQLLENHQRQTGTGEDMQMQSQPQQQPLQQPQIPQMQPMQQPRGIDVALMMGGAGLQGKDPSEVLKNLMDVQRMGQMGQMQQNVTPQQLGALLQNYNAALPPGYQAGYTAEGRITANRPASWISTNIENLLPQEQPIARAMARRLYGVRGAEKGLSNIVNARLQGISYDQIEDSIRLSSQSPEFSGALRDAAQMVSIGNTENQRNADYDALDDYVQKGEMGGAKDYLREMARKTTGTEQANKVAGQERTLELLDEIRNDIAVLDANNQTGFIAGKLEGMVGRIGTMVRPELRAIATKVANAVIEFRRYATGVNFSMPEYREYKTLFPSIDKTGKFNTTNTEALSQVFSGNLKRFYSQKFGRKNYDTLFGEDYERKTTKVATPVSSQSKKSSFRIIGVR